MSANQDLSWPAHFSFNELTITNNAKLQEQNRKEAQASNILANLKVLAELLEKIRTKTGPLEIHSGFRCPTLNGATVGSSLKSQHMQGQACDFSRPGPDTEASVNGLHNDVLDALLEQGLVFGQLIKECTDRRYGKSVWLHLSLGMPYRNQNKCGQVLEMRNGIYTFVRQVKFPPQS